MDESAIVQNVAIVRECSRLVDYGQYRIASCGRSCQVSFRVTYSGLGMFYDSCNGQGYLSKCCDGALPVATL